MKSIWPELVILGVDRIHSDDHNLVSSYLNPVSTGEGYFEGARETVFLVQAGNEAMVQKVGADLGIDHYHFLGADRTLELRDLRGNLLKTYKGQFQQVTEEQAKTLEYWTFFQGTYYGVV